MHIFELILQSIISIEINSMSLCQRIEVELNSSEIPGQQDCYNMIQATYESIHRDWFLNMRFTTLCESI